MHWFITKPVHLFYPTKTIYLHNKNFYNSQALKLKQSTQGESHGK